LDFTDITNSFLKNGFVVVPKLFDEETTSVANDLLSNFDYSKNNNIVFDEGGNIPKYFQGINTHIKYFNKFLSSTLLNIVKELLNQEVYFNDLELHNKLPKIGTSTPSHQDNFYFCLSPPDCVTAYIALSPQNEENGGLSFVPGSHKQETQMHKPSDTKAFSSYFECDLTNYTCPNLNPGDTIFHHANTVHFASTNTSDQIRTSLSVRIPGVNAKKSEKLSILYEKYKKNNRK
jgi:phytanoyl-CoA hydroxylase